MAIFRKMAGRNTLNMTASDVAASIRPSHPYIFPAHSSYSVFCMQIYVSKVKYAKDFPLLPKEWLRKKSLSFCGLSKKMLSLHTLVKITVSTVQKT